MTENVVAVGVLSDEFQNLKYIFSQGIGNKNKWLSLKSKEDEDIRSCHLAA
jgi:hypothetical protein